MTATTYQQPVIETRTRAERVLEPVLVTLGTVFVICLNALFFVI